MALAAAASFTTTLDHARGRPAVRAEDDHLLGPVVHEAADVELGELAPMVGAVSALHLGPLLPLRASATCLGERTPQPSAVVRLEAAHTGTVHSYSDACVGFT